MRHRLLALITLVAQLTAAEPSKPHILFIIADNLATGPGCYGDKVAITPNLDRLASEGVVFSHAYVQGAVCTSSRTAFMLGLNTRHARPAHRASPQGGKGAKANGIVERLVLLPTFCDFAGLPAPDTLDDKSFLPLIKDPKAEGKPGAFCQWGNGRTVRTLRWRLVERGDGCSELSDHSIDDSEYHNVIATGYAIAAFGRDGLALSLRGRPRAASDSAVRLTSFSSSRGL